MSSPNLFGSKRVLNVLEKQEQFELAFEFAEGRNFRLSGFLRKGT